MMHRRYAAVALASAFLLSGTARAADVAALVLDYTGKANPLLQDYSEVPAGTKVELGAGGKLTVLHYKTCHTITVTGGSVIIGADDVQTKGGTRTQEASDQCPQEVKFKVAGIGGGVLMRGANELLPPSITLPTSLACGLVGAKADKVDGVTVMDGNTAVTPVAIAAHRLSLPPTAPALESGHGYTLVMRVAGKTTTDALPITVTNTPAAGTCLIRIE